MAKTTVLIDINIGAQVPPTTAWMIWAAPFEFDSGNSVVLPVGAPVKLAAGIGQVEVDPGVWMVTAAGPGFTKTQAWMVPESDIPVQFSTLVEITDEGLLGFGPTWAARAELAALYIIAQVEEAAGSATAALAYRNQAQAIADAMPTVASGLIAAALDPFTETLGQFELQPMNARGHSWIGTNTNATPNARVHERLARRLAMGAITNKGVGGRTIGDISNLALGGVDRWVPRTKALGFLVCTINDITLFDGSAASRRGYNHAWRSLLSQLTANAAVAANTQQFAFSAGWATQAAVGVSSDAQGAIANSTSGTRWRTTTVGSYVDIAFTGTDVDLHFVARAAGAGLITVTEGATTLDSIDLTATTAQDTNAVLALRGLAAGTHTVRATLTSGASMTVDSYRIPSTAPIPILVLGEPPVIPTGADHASYLADVETFKGDLENICASFSTVKYLDLAQAAWDTTTMLSTDGKHPNDRGAAWIAARCVETLATFGYLVGLNVLAPVYPSAYVAPAGPAIPAGGQDGTGFTGGVPAQVTGLTINPVSHGLELAWTAPSGVPTDYIVQYRLPADSSWTTFADGTSAATSVVITGLVDGTIYDTHVAASNGAGTGPFSETKQGVPNTSAGGTDNFSGGTGESIVGRTTTTGGKTWQVTGGTTVQVTSGGIMKTLAGSGNSHPYILVESQNVAVEGTITALPASIGAAIGGLAVKIDTASQDGIDLQIRENGSTYHYTITKRIAGATSILATSTVTPAVGDRVRLEAYGGSTTEPASYRAIVNGAEIISTSYLGLNGKLGIGTYMNRADGGAFAIDDFAWELLP